MEDAHWVRSLKSGIRRECSAVSKLIRKVQMSPADVRKWKMLGFGKIFGLQVQHLAVCKASTFPKIIIQHTPVWFQEKTRG